MIHWGESDMIKNSRLLQKMECDYKFDRSWKVILPLQRVESDE